MASKHPAISRTAPPSFARLATIIRFPPVARLSGVRRLAIPVIATAAVFLIQAALFPDPGIAPFVFLYVAVALSSWLGGRASGLLSVALSAAVANYAFVGDDVGWSTSGPELAATALFVVAASIVALMCAAFRDSALKAQEAAEAIQRGEEAQARLAEIVENTEDAVVSVDLGGVISSWNAGAERLFGYSREEAVGSTLAETVPVDRRDEEQSIVARITAGERVGHYESERLTKTGERRILSVSASPIRGREGRVIGVSKIARDITESKRNENRARRLFDAGIVGVIYWTVDGAITDANDKFLAMTGYTREDLEAGRIDWARMTPPEWHHLDESALEDFRASGTSPPFEKEYIRKDGTRLPVIVGGAMLDEARDEGVAFVLDIADRKRAEQAVNESEKRLRRANAELEAERMRWQGVVEGIAEEVWICDAEGRMSLLNLPEATAMGLEEFESKNVDEVLEEVEILHADGKPRPPEEAPLLRSLRTGEVLRGEEIMRHRRTGRVRHRQFSCAPTRDATGAITGAVAIVRDITKTKETELALIEADRRKDEFLAMLAHELRNPLAPIRSSLYILDRVATDGDKAQRARATIDRQIFHLTRLVGDLLDVSRITRGKIELQREPLDVCDLAERTVEDHRPLFDANRVELELDRPSAPIWVNGDPTRLAQALGNMLQNAAKFTSAGDTAAVLVRQEGASVVLTVRDSGVGIAPDVMDRIFEPFTQADRSLAHTSGGLGLGLALAKGLVVLHGGEVRAASAGLGRGSEFSIRLPIGAQPIRTQRPVSHPPKARARRVLVIEDNVDAAESLKEALELEDHVVVLAFTGPEGLDKARVFLPDVVLCDIGLPGMDGYDVARAFRSDLSLRNIPLVALTGYAGPEDQRRALGAGFDRHMAKPPDMMAIERFLGEVPQRVA